jgi:iron complex outermembrane receptor protein
VLSNETGVPERFDFNLLLFSGTAKYDLGWASLLSATSYQILSAATVEDETYFLAPAGIPYANLTEYPKVDKFVQEVRLTSETHGPVDWLVGAYFTREHSADPEFVYDYSTPGVLLPPPLAVGEVAALNATYNEYAGYADLTWHITPRLDLGGGARYSYNEQVYSQGIGGPLAGGPVTFSPDTSSHEGVFTWDVNPSYHITSNDMVYARIATGFQPGAPNAIPANVTTAPKFYNSSTLIDYEVGLKSTFLDGRALADISAFYIDWSDIQVLVYYPTCPCTLEGNGGHARSEGVNFDGSYSPLTGLRLGATVTYTDAVATSPIASLETVAGARLPFAPLWAASLTADYSAPLAGPWSYNLGAAFRYGGKSWGAVQGAEEATPSGLVPTAFLDPAYNVLDLHAGVSGEGWRVSLYVKNVTNDLYLRNSTVLYSFLGTPAFFAGDIAQPRTFGLSVDKSF